MKPHEERPTHRLLTGERWVARTDVDSPEARAGALLRQAVLREPLGAERLAAIRSRLRRDVRRPQRHWVLRLAIAVGLLVSGGALTTAGQRYFHLLVPGKAVPVETPAPSPPHAKHARIAARAPALAPTPPGEIGAPIEGPPAAQPTPEERKTPASRPTITRPTGVTPAPFVAPGPPPSPLAQESTLLSEALRKLRQDDDPRGALALLDEHAARFATGSLTAEATRARIEALIRTHRNGDALALLERAAPSPTGSGRDLLIARAELRAAAGHCSAAAADFDLLLNANRPLDTITERALWGRASCRAGVDAAGARSDVTDYLRSFPGGRFAAEARAALAE